jgi:predicted ribosome quality control (RQC) complex YloA/Tae2 family protein
MKQYTYNNIEIVVGSNAKENWDLLELSDKTWIILHLDKFTSPYVIIKNNNPTNDTINYAAHLCKDNSKWKFLKLAVLYTPINNVRKGSKLGEFIMKGKYKTITI